MAKTAPLVKKETKEITPAEITRSGTYYTPRVDICETDDELTFLCDMPGVKPQDVELCFERGELCLRGKVTPRQQPAEYLRDEYGVGDFYRTFTIATDINADKISADYKLGVLTVHLPKAEKIKPKRIPVKASN